MESDKKMEKDEIGKRRAFIINFLYFAIILGLVIFFMRYVIYAIMPFFIAFVVSLILRPIVRFLYNKLKVSKRISSIVLVVLFYLGIGTLTVIAGINIVEYIEEFCMKLPGYFNNDIIPAVTKLNRGLSGFLDNNNIDYDLNEVIASIGGSISDLSTTIFSFTGSIAVSLPGLIVDVIICVVATYFLTVDMGIFKKFIDKQLSVKAVNIVDNIKSHFGKTIWNYIRSYALIVIITFTELIIGFLIIGISNPTIVAMLIAIFDILPIVGCGTILLPWIVIAAVQGKSTLAIGLLIIYVIITVVRNIIEPKIVGHHVGLHPLVTLMAMIIGSYVFGPLGLLGLPIALVIIKDMNEEGIIHIYNSDKISNDDNKED